MPLSGLATAPVALHPCGASGDETAVGRFCGNGVHLDTKVTHSVVSYGQNLTFEKGRHLRLLPLRSERPDENELEPDVVTSGRPFAHCSEDVVVVDWCHVMSGHRKLNDRR